MTSRKNLAVAFGNVIRAFRLRSGMSQEALAGVAEVHRTYVSSVERGERNISLQNIDRLLTSLGKSWIDLGKALEDELDRQ